MAEGLFNAGGGGENETDNARSSKTARAGARVGRVVRVLRLFRIVKLFKAAQISRKRTGKERTTKAGEEITWTEEQEAEAQLRESLVGKKLSARTTQRTIVLVLIMLIVIPLLSIEGLSLTPASAEYGADEVLQHFNAMMSGQGGRDWDPPRGVISGQVDPRFAGERPHVRSINMLGRGLADNRGKNQVLAHICRIGPRL